MKKIILTPEAAKRIGQFNGVILFTAEGENTTAFEIKLQTAPKMEGNSSFKAVLIQEPFNGFINN